MNMNDLNKNQLILLALLVSFVTSIATGIVTVSLMDQAPAGVTRTINQVVEKTVQVLQPGSETTHVVTQEVVVDQSDRIKTAIQKNLPGLIVFVTGTGIDEQEIGSGFMVTKDGLAVTDNDVASNIASGNVLAKYGGETLKVEAISSKTDSSVGLFKLSPQLSADGKEKVLPDGFFVPLALAKDGALALGGVVIGVDATNGTEITSGIIKRLEKDSAGEGIALIHTDISAGTSGGPLLLIDGSVAGVSVSSEEGLSAVPSSTITKMIHELSQEASVKPQDLQDQNSY